MQSRGKKGEKEKNSCSATTSEIRNKAQIWVVRNRWSNLNYFWCTSSLSQSIFLKKDGFTCYRSSQPLQLCCQMNLVFLIPGKILHVGYPFNRSAHQRKLRTMRL